ncbi:MAG: ImuA family protein [Paracoccaceae bacterium]
MIAEHYKNIYPVSMTARLISRSPRHHPTSLPLPGGLTLTCGRAHEFCGPARRTLALIAAQAIEGPVFWIAPDWSRDRLHGEGVAALFDPARITFITPHRPEDLLWSMEEVLRSGAAPLAICELPGIPGLTPVRRLHLAAETAGREQGSAPLGLLLIAGSGGAPGVESRWHMKPAHAGKQNRWRLERRRARMDPPKCWEVTRSGSTFSLGPPGSNTETAIVPQPAGCDKDARKPERKDRA